MELFNNNVVLKDLHELLQDSYTFITFNEESCTEERANGTITSIGACYEDLTIGNIRMYDCENISIDGVILRDSANWTAAFFGCNNIKINNIKIKHLR